MAESCMGVCITQLWVIAIVEHKHFTRCDGKIRSKLKTGTLNYGTVQRVNIQDFVAIGEIIPEIWRFFDFFKMAAVRHLGFVISMFETPMKSIWRHLLLTYLDWLAPKTIP